MAVHGDHDVRGLQVAVDDAFVVGAGECFGHLGGELQRAGERKGLSLQQIAELLALDELHGDESGAVRFVDLEDGGDVRMVERGGRLGLLDEAPPPFLVGDQFRRQHLESHLAIELGVEGPVDDPHAAAADLVEDLVVGKRLTDHVSSP